MLRLNAVHLAVCLLPLALAGCGEPADHRSANLSR
ncbi:hypothetical protein ACQR94_29835, partial [Klebsiella pneumoniae]